MVDSFLPAGGGFSSGYFPGRYRSIGRKDDAVKNIWTSVNFLFSGQDSP